VKRGDGSHNARPAVILGIQKQPGANTLELTERIDATLAEIQQALPRHADQQNLFRSADFIEQALNNLFTALLEGAGLVIVVVIVFLMNARPPGSRSWPCRSP
jgi:multidrug efflux pump subunit AcrB